MRETQKMFEIRKNVQMLMSNPTENYHFFYQNSNRGMFSWQMLAPPWPETAVTWFNTFVAQLRSKKSSFEGSHMRLMSKKWSMSQNLGTAWKCRTFFFWNFSIPFLDGFFKDLSSSLVHNKIAGADFEKIVLEGVQIYIRVQRLHHGNYPLTA